MSCWESKNLDAAIKSLLDYAQQRALIEAGEAALLRFFETVNHSL